MERIEYRIMDKSGWPRGAWDSEPDKIQWQDEDTGLPCLIVRNSAGALCGYVGVSKGHPCYAKDYDGIDVDVHGGLTFSDHCSNGDEAEVICHKPAAGESDDVWWLGFDCGHYRDLVPLYEIPFLEFKDKTIYRDIAYVTAQCQSLAKQLAVYNA